MDYIEISKDTLDYTEISKDTLDYKEISKDTLDYTESDKKGEIKTNSQPQRNQSFQYESL